MPHRIRRCTIQAPFQVRSLAPFGLASDEASLRFARRLRRVPFRYPTS